MGSREKIVRGKCGWRYHNNKPWNCLKIKFSLIELQLHKCKIKLQLPRSTKLMARVDKMRFKLSFNTFFCFRISSSSALTLSGSLQHDDNSEHHQFMFWNLMNLCTMDFMQHRWALLDHDKSHDYANEEEMRFTKSILTRKISIDLLINVNRFTIRYQWINLIQRWNFFDG